MGEAEDGDLMDVDMGTEAAVKQEPAERPVTRERAVGSGVLACGLLRVSLAWQLH